ncbi:hypothetical protein KUCAC02_024657, partial [Chaenocephalus aceratus]
FGSCSPRRCAPSQQHSRYTSSALFVLSSHLVLKSCQPIVRLKMAARDEARPVWPAKHCPLQIPLFIHKLTRACVAEVQSQGFSLL